MSELDDAIERLKRMNNPALLVEDIASLLRNAVASAGASGLLGDVTIRTFGDAGVARSGEGLFIKSDKYGLEIAVTIELPHNVDVTVRSTNAWSNRPFADVVHSFITTWMRQFGIKPLEKDDT